MEGSKGQGLGHFRGKDIPEGVVGLTWREDEKERIWKEYLEGESLRQSGVKEVLEKGSNI